MLWLKRLLRIKGHILLWSSLSLATIWLLLLTSLHLVAAKPDLLYGLANLAGATLTIGRFDSQTHPMAVSVTLSLEKVALAWRSGRVQIDQLSGDISLWNLLTPDLAIGHEMRIRGMQLTLIADDQHTVNVSAQPLSNPWLRFWENTQIDQAEVIWQAESPWRLDDIHLSLIKEDAWQAHLTAQWHYPGFTAMPLTATAQIDHQFGFNPKATFSAELSPSNLLIFGQHYQGKLNLTGNWDAQAIRAQLNVQTEDHLSPEGEKRNQLIGALHSEDLVNWEILLQELKMNGERIALPVWPRLSINPQQGAKLTLHQVRLTAQDRWISMLPANITQIWQTWQPELWLKQLSLAWTSDGQLSAIRGGIDILRWQAQDIAPGMDLRDITFDYNPQQGRLQIIPSGDSQLLWQWPNHPPIALSATPFVLVLDPKQPLAHWELPLWHITLGEVTLDLQVNTHAQTDISAQLSAPNLASLQPLLPMHQFSTALQKWLTRALSTGDKVTLNAAYRGHITDLLTGGWNEDQLQLSGQLDKVTLAFDSRYPALSHANLQLKLAKDGLHLYTAKAKLGDVDVESVQADVLFFDDAKDDAKIALRINGKYQTTLPHAKQFLLSTPLAKLIGIEEMLTNTQLNGQAQGRISLWIPLNGYPADEGEKLLGYAYIQQGQWQDSRLQINNLETKLLFSEKKLDIPTLKGQWLNGQMSGRLKQEDKTLRLLLSGTTPLDIPELVEGEVTWKSDIRLLPKGQIEAKIIGQQDKLARLLPAPFAQKKGTRNDWKLNINHKNADTQIYWQDQAWRVVGKLTTQDPRLTIQKLQLTPLTDSDVNSAEAILLRIPQLDLIAWLEWYERLSAQSSETNSLPALPSSGKLHVDQLHVQQQRYQQVSAQWQKSEFLPLKVAITGDGLTGTWVSHKDDSAQLTLSRLRWQLPYQTASDKLSAPLPQCAKPSHSNWSKLRIHIDELDLMTERPEGIQLTPITQLSTEIYQEGDIRYLKDIRFAYKTLRAQGAWMWHKGRDHANLFLKTTATKAEHFAALFGLENSLDGGALATETFADWQGGLDCFDLRTVSASLQLTAQEGSLADTSPGLARLLGLLSFDAFTRRLKFGLTDVTGAGLAYDHIQLNAQLSHGLLSVEAMKLSGPSVNMTLSGSTDLIGETHQLKAQVTPLIGDSIPTIALLSGVSPITAIGVYLLQKFIPPLNGNILSFDYDITGSWQTPDLKGEGEP